MPKCGNVTTLVPQPDYKHKEARGFRHPDITFFSKIIIAHLAFNPLKNQPITVILKAQQGS